MLKHVVDKKKIKYTERRKHICKSKAKQKRDRKQRREKSAAN